MIFNINVFSILYYNIRSIVLHLNNILLYLNTIFHTFDLIILIETWVNINLNINIDGYITLHFLGILN